MLTFLLVTSVIVITITLVALIVTLLRPERDIFGLIVVGQLISAIVDAAISVISSLLSNK